MFLVFIFQAFDDIFNSFVFGHFLSEREEIN